MASIDRTTYPRFKGALSDQELESIFRPTDQDVRFVRKRAETDHGRLCLLVLLKCHQYLGFLPAVSDVPSQVTRYLRAAFRLSADTPFRSPSRILRQRYRTLIHNYLGVKPYAQGGREVATEVIRKAARTMSDPADLINAAIEQLFHKRLELPAYSTLDRLAGRLRQEIHAELCALVAAKLPKADVSRLEALLKLRPKETRGSFHRLKESPGRPTLSEMRRWVEHLDWVDGILSDDTERLLGDVAHTKRRQLAAEARALELSEMRGIRSNDKRRTLLICLVHYARTHARDALATMFLKRVRRIYAVAEEKLARLRDDHRKIEERMVTALSQVAEHASAITAPATLGRRVRVVLDALGGAEEVQEQCRRVSAWYNNNHLPLLWDIYRAHRRALLRLVGHLDVQSATQESSLLDALDKVLQNRDKRRDHVPMNIDLGFASERWKAQIVRHFDDGDALDRRQLEVCVLSCVASGLRCGDLFVPGSVTFADYREQLLPWSVCQERLPAYCEQLAIPADGRAFAKEIKKKLSKMIRKVDDDYRKNAEFSIDTDGRPHLKRTKPRSTPPKAKELMRRVRERMPDRHLLDILRDVHHWTSYTRRFGPLSGTGPRLRKPLSRYLFTIFALGCGLGPSQTARHSLGEVTSRVIDRINRQHVTTSNLEAALRDIIAKYKAMELPRAWGTGDAAIADGTHVELRENNLLGERHIRYGGYGGIAYHHISDTYVALFSRFIACGVWEGVYILDGLLCNTSELRPSTVHADTQGQSEPIFALALLLGIKLMPRMRTWNDVTFYRADPKARYKNINQLFTSVADWKLIETHWNDMMQVALSIQAGKVLPSMLLQRLGTYSRKNTLYRAFRELGRVARTLYLLEYISDGPLRQRVDGATTKIESFNAFCDWVSFGGEAFTSDDPVEQEKRVKYTTLVANAVMLRNVVDLTDVLVKLAGEGFQLSEALLSMLSPYMTRHIKRFGSFVIDTETAPPPLDFIKIPLST